MKVSEKPNWSVKPACAKFARINAEGDKDIVIFDLETTGLNITNDRIVQIGAVKLATKAPKMPYQITGRLNMYLNPLIPMGAKASEVNHITDDMLRDKPTETEAIKEIEQFFGDPLQTVYAGFNIKKFDLPMMEELYQRCLGYSFGAKEIADCKEMAEEMLYRPKIVEALLKEVESPADLKRYAMRLKYVARYLNVSVSGQLHDSETDTGLTGAVMWTLLSMYLQEISDRSKPAIWLDCLWRQKYKWNADYVFVRCHTDTSYGRILAQLHYDITHKKYVEDQSLLNGQPVSIVENANMHSLHAAVLKRVNGDFNSVPIQNPKDEGGK